VNKGEEKGGVRQDEREREEEDFEKGRQSTLRERSKKEKYLHTSKETAEREERHRDAHTNRDPEKKIMCI